MQDSRIKGSKRYIKLVEGPIYKPDFRKGEVIPYNRVIELSGKGWAWVWNRPSEVVLTQGGLRQRYPIVDPTRILQFLLYGLSLLFILAGMFMILGKRKGE